MEQPEKIDIIILSYARSEDLKQTTINAVESLMQSEDPAYIQFNIIVIESEKQLQPWQYAHSTTLYLDEEFGYNKYMNIGIAMTSAKYVCLCNNDLIFHKNWAMEILKPFKQYTDIYSASPACSIHHPKNGFKLNSGYHLGYRIRQELAGWCIFFRRDMLKITGQLDPNYTFWCADNDYNNTLWMLKIKHLLVTSSIVDHLENMTLNDHTDEEQLELTEKQSVYFNKKWLPKTGDGWIAL